MSRTTIGKYVDLELIGQGGMAEVYIGTDPALNRKVAIKLILPHFADQSDFEARFQREAKTIAGLRHGNIVQIYEFSIEDGAPFMVMEYLDGGTLDDILAKYKAQGGPMPLEETADILDKIASGLDYAHKRGLIHRDIKPANILISDDGEPIIADFGIVKLLDEAAVLTQTGGVVGSPRYLPPEQASQKEIDKRSDIYSLGIVLYQMVTGEVPFDGDLISVMMQHVNQLPENPVTINPDLSYGTANVILKALEKDPNDRYDSVGEMAKAFRKSLKWAASSAPAVKGEPTPQAETKTSDPKEKLAPKPSAKPGSGKTIGIVFGVVLIAVLGFMAFGGGFGADKDTLTLNDTQASNDVPSADDNVTEIDEEANAVDDQPEDEPTAVSIDTTTPHGDIVFRESTLTITLYDLNPPDEGFIYLAWLTEPKADPLYLGTIEAVGGEISFTDPEGRDLLMSFSGFVITEEPDSNGEPALSGTIIYEAQVDAQVLLDYRHLKNISGGTIDQAISSKMVTQANSFTDHTSFALTAMDSGSLNSAKNHAEHTINIASGVGSDDYFDWDNDGRPENPSDDVGLLPYVRLFANALTIADSDILIQVNELITQIGVHVSFMKKITASDTLDEAATHAEQLYVQQGQILEKITSLLKETETALVDE